MQHPHHYFLCFVIFLLCAVFTTAIFLGPERSSTVLAQTAQIYYVDNVSGLDTNIGTETAPFKTVTKASAIVNPGDIIRIKVTTTPYQETIFPTKSGTASARITYEGWGGKPKFITYNANFATQDGKGCVDIRKQDYITIRNLICDGRGNAALGENYLATGFVFFARVYGGNYNIIESNEFIGALRGYATSYHGNGVDVYGDGTISPVIYARYNKILNNKIITTGYNAWHALRLGTYASNNLVEGNELIQTAGEPGPTHQAVQVLSSYNIVRNNRITNGSWTGVSFERNGTSSEGDHNIFEGNRVFDTYPGSQTGNGAMQMANQKAIIRRNFFYQNPAFGFGVYRGTGTEEARYLNQNHIYQNTFYKNILVTPPPIASDATIKFAVGCGVPLAGNTQDNVIKNNIFFNNGSASDKQLNIKLGCTDPTGSGTATVPIYGLNGMIIAGNSMLSGVVDGAVYHIEEASGAYLKSLSQIQNLYPTLVYQNIETDPLFTNPDAGTPDFTPRSGSPVIDKGVFLTKALPQSGTTIQLLDPYYFIDGYGVTLGDQIKFKSSGAVRRITSLNYDTGIATLDSAITLPAVGDDVALVYNGNAPDIGAVETTYPAPGPGPAPVLPTTISNLTFSFSTDTNRSLSGKALTVSILPAGSAKGATALENQTSTANGQNQVALATTNRTSGSYDVRVKAPSTLSRKQTFTLASNQTFTLTNKLISGDINNDNAINALDWSMMSPDWFQTNKASDINGDGITNALDFTWLNRNWFLVGE